MSLLQRLLDAFGRLQASRRFFHFDDELVESLQMLSELEQRSEEDLAADLLSAALAQRAEAVNRIQVWRSLTRREQQTVALTCLGYTNPQIAAHLVLSTQTVRTYTRSALHKFGVTTKAELRQLLRDWDFSDWG